MTWRRWASFSCFALAASLSARPAAAQLAPTGGHYAGRGSDTGFAGAVNSSGGYGASVPLDLPAARGGLPVPLHIVYGEHGVGAAGQGWDVPLSFIRRDTSFAHRRPVGSPGFAPPPHEQVSLVLEGRRMILVQTASGWVAQRDAPDLLIREQGDGTWVMYDGQGRTYLFTAADPALAGADLWHLASVTGPGGNKVALGYTVGSPSVPGAPGAVSIDLSTVQYNPDSSGCYKNLVTLGYDTSTGPLSISPLGNLIFVRVHPLVTVTVAARATCGASPETLRTYLLDYFADPDTRLPRLVKVRMTGRQGTPEASTQVIVGIYTYSGASVNGQLTYQSQPDISLSTLAYPLASTDVDSLIHPQGQTGLSTNRSFTDVTGDGRPDVVFRNDPVSSFFLNTPTGSGGSTHLGDGGTTPFVPSQPGRAPFEIREISGMRYDNLDGVIHDDMVWQQAIDVDGDGRVDHVTAMEGPGFWAVYLNTPDPTDPRKVVWQRRTFSTSALAQQLRARGVWTGDDFLPLARRSTSHDDIFDVCISWNTSTRQWQWFEDDGSVVNGDCPAGGGFIQTLPVENSYTAWELKDINGDGYPDVVFNSSALATVENINTNFPPPQHPQGFHMHTTSVRTLQPAAGNGNEIDAVYNVAGVHLTSVSDNPFSAPVTLRFGAPCGVARWTAIDDAHQQLMCSIVDVNGDGIADLVNGTAVSLGTGSRGPGTFFTPGAVLTLPGPLSIQSNSQTSSCAPPADGNSTFSVFQAAALRDVTGDGIPDYISTSAGTWRVAIGNGTGFLPPSPVNGSFAISEETEDCAGAHSRTTRGLYDIDGDGKPDFVTVTVGSHAMSVSRLVGGDGLPAPGAGRLVQINNAYGAATKITYRSAKEDATTLHQVPFPEIVVASVETVGSQGFGGDLSATLYAYGGADLVFDPALDTFLFPGYRRAVQLQIPASQTQGVAIITDTFGPATRTDPYGLVSSGGSCCAALTVDQRYNLYLRTGRTSDVAVLSGNLGTDAWALLGTNLTNDSRRIAGTHYEWGSQLLAQASDPPSEVCSEMVLPYDYTASESNSASHGAYNPCAAHGFAFAQSVQSWRGDPGAAPPATANVETRSEVLAIDSLGRATRVRHSNDVHRDDDDVCVDTTFAAPTGANERVLFAASSRTTSDCGSLTLAKDTFEYDKLAVGSVSTGFPTAHTVERRDELGVLRSTVREFDTTFDAFGNPLIITTSRGDAARTTTIAYDPFKLVPTTLTMAATGLPTRQIVIARDPVTLNAVTTTDPNGTQHGTTFDGFDRPVLSLVTPPGGAQGALSVTSYVGFTTTESPVRSVIEKVFTEPVNPDPDTVNTAVGRTSTVFLDELGRPMRTEIALGASYSNQKLIAGRRTYDSLGRVAFEADPFPASQSFATAYGTTQLFNVDGTPKCVIRGNGPQAAVDNPTTDESHEVFPTCMQRGFQNHTEIVNVRDASSLLAGSPQDGVVKSSASSAIGWIISRSTWQEATRLEHIAFTYDRLGRQTGMTRFQDAQGITKPVTSSWHFDSLGQLLELDEPQSVPQLNTYSDWGELVETRRDITVNGTAGPALVVKHYDALGRVTHSEERFNGVVDARTVSDYSYDQGVNVAPQVTPTNVLGRLAQASSPTGAVAFSYDSLGQINARVFTDAHGGMYVETHTTHADGSPAALDLFLPDTGFADEHVAYNYDSAGRATSVTYANGTNTEDLFEATSIDPLGRVRDAAYGVTGYMATYAETGRQLLTQAFVSSPLGPSRTITYQSYDPVGRERSRLENKNGGTPGVVTTSGYDALGRLTSSVKTSGIKSQFNQQLTYDALGNILTRTAGNAGGTSTTLSYLDLDRDRICRISYGSDTGTVCNVTYDQFGNITDEPTRTGSVRHLSFFFDGNPSSVTDGTTSAQFRYDAFGEVQELDLTSTTSPDTRHDRRYGGLIAWQDETVGTKSHSVLTRKIPGPDGFLATRHGSAGPWIFAFGEDRGNRFFTDDTGAFVQDVDYSPYGEPTSTGAAPGSPQYSHEQWNGGDALAALGLSHLGARLYDPVIGRFLSRDPLLIPRTAATTNPYAFANNDPVNGSDPSGLETRTACSSCTERPPGPDGRPNIEDTYIINDGGDAEAPTFDYSDLGGHTTHPGIVHYPSHPGTSATPAPLTEISRAADVARVIGRIGLQVDAKRREAEPMEGPFGEQVFHTDWAEVLPALLDAFVDGFKSQVDRLYVYADDAHNGNYRNYTPNQRTQMAWDFLGVGSLVNSLKGGRTPRTSQVLPTKRIVAGIDEQAVIARLRPEGRLIGVAGSSAPVRMLSGGAAAAEALFHELAQGGEVITGTRYPGTRVKLQGGGTIGYRSISTSGPPTIDVEIKGLGIREIKFK
jgi:RHS repeat-associated protein